MQLYETKNLLKCLWRLIRRSVWFFSYDFGWKIVSIQNYRLVFSGLQLYIEICIHQFSYSIIDSYSWRKPRNRGYWQLILYFHDKNEAAPPNFVANIFIRRFRIKSFGIWSFESLGMKISNFSARKVEAVHIFCRPKRQKSCYPFHWDRWLLIYHYLYSYDKFWCRHYDRRTNGKIESPNFIICMKF